MGIRRFGALSAGITRGLWRYRLRSILLIVSAALGVAGVTVSADFSNAGRAKVLKQLRSLGTNVIVVSPRIARASGGRTRPGGPAISLVQRDYQTIRREVGGIELASRTSTASFLVKAGDLSKNNCTVTGTEASYAKIRSWSVARGRYFDAAEDRRSVRVAVLGAGVAADLFGAQSAIGGRIYVNRLPFEVVGVMSERGEDLDGGGADNTVYVPLATAMHRLSNIEYYSSIVLQVGAWQRMSGVASEVDAILSRTHRPVGKNPVDYQILNQRTLIDAETAATRRLGGYVAAVGAGALLIAGFGILAISWISVRERVPEIGLRRAIGATQQDIFWQFVCEALGLSVVGCILGLGASIGGSYLIWRSESAETFNWRNAAQTCAMALFLNLTFALLPAYLASKQDAIRALRAA